MSNNGNIPELDKLLHDLDLLDAEAEREVERARGWLDQALQRQRVIRAMRKAGGVEPEKPPKKKQGGKTMSDQKLDEILLAITAFSRTHKTEFTVRDVIEFSGISQPSVNLAFNILRDRGELRKVGVDNSAYKRAIYSLDEV